MVARLASTRPRPSSNAAGQHHDARAEAVAERAPAEGGEAHGQEVERHRGRDAGARPAGVGGIGSRNTASENIEPMPTQVISAPAATTTQP